MTDPVITARSLELGYGRSVVVRSLDLEVRRGELWFILGPNGSGKSTFLKAVLGLVKPLGGELELSGELGRGRFIGFVPQRCDVKPTLPMTVEEFVRLGLTGSGVDEGAARESVAWALARVGLGDKARRDYWALSGGQRQRALVARGLARRPRLLILDEPTNGLDLASEESLLELVASLNEGEGLTVLFVTHAILLAARFAHRVALFSRGTATSGPPREVLAPRTLREAYGVAVQVAYDSAGLASVRMGG